jgi:O-acetylhomoserine/O-acetylserine sulfhydrylase-like pyridoxal-dependent enzyme
VDVFEKRIAALEGGVAAVVCATKLLKSGKVITALAM